MAHYFDDINTIQDTREVRKNLKEAPPFWSKFVKFSQLLRLKYLSIDLGSKNYFIDDYFNIADISAFISLEYVDIRFKELDWRREFPNLDNYWKFHNTRDSFANTKPSSQKIDPITY